jgi:hypothetical protein
VHIEPTFVVAAGDAGSARALTGAIERLADRGLRPELIAYPQAWNSCSRTGLPCRRVERFEQAELILNDLAAPVFLLTGISTEHREEGRFWDWARRRGIPSLAFLSRRTDPAGATAADAPDVVAVIDEEAEANLQRAGLDPRRLMVVGHPALDRLHGLEEHRLPGLRSTLIGPDGDRMVLFLSEPLSQMGRAAGSFSRGYTETDSLSAVIQALERIGRDTGTVTTLVVRLHPAELREPTAEVLANHDSTRHVRTVLPDPLIDRHELAYVADAVAGITSTDLLDARALGTPAISVQPGGPPTDDLPGVPIAIDVESTRRSLLEVLAEPAGLNGRHTAGRILADHVMRHARMPIPLPPSEGRFRDLGEAS